MSAMFEMPTADLTLSKTELTAITGCGTSKGALEWLQSKKWHHVTNRAGEPIVGRLYATMKLSGVEVKTMIHPEAWTPDFSGLQ